ncbi:DNA-binding transcriptional LysR family regulator [Mesorhizobium soli]|jgi:DNA-binding transcriptional LysR family regulator|uniref:LysR family transcriptional regulator n=1 Tax=Pseudaminobacter soli (ex Li et al. 2025) TaxID=1295366 RepID=UPI00247699D5|nr:LysR family transcriptional regulator [Mesorhizobium soli]MDH6234142.1 DNA-binding transcriptional LysR family regulator [Mesorhizobium soli]
MQLRHLRTFVAVADTLNFTRAAERIHLSQSSVTEQVQTLEADIGARLFDRSRKGITLTPAGERLLGYAAELLKLAEEAQSAVTGASDVSGSLTIGGLETLCTARLSQLLAEFHRRHPTVELTLRTADSSGLRSGIRSGDLDVGFIFGQAMAGLDLQSETVMQEDLLVILPAGHRLAGRLEAGPEDLAEDVFLVTQEGCVYRRMFDEAFAQSLPERPKLVGEFASIGSIRGLVDAGLGCALVPRAALLEQSERLVAIAWKGSSRTVPMTMMWRRKRVRSPAVAAFLTTAREFFVDHTRR